MYKSRVLPDYMSNHQKVDCIKLINNLKLILLHCPLYKLFHTSILDPVQIYTLYFHGLLLHTSTPCSVYIMFHIYVYIYI